MVNLYKAKKNNSFNVVSLPDVGMLHNLGLRAGTHIRIQQRYGFGGPVLLRVEDAFSVAIGKDIASQILVKEALKS